MNNLSRMIRGALAFGALSTVLVIGCDSSNRSASDSFASSNSSLPRVTQDASSAAPDATAVVRRGDIAGQITVRARVAAVVEQPLFFSRTGWIKFLNVKIGEQVEAGSVLAEMDDPDLADRLQNAEAAVETSRLALAQAQLPPPPGRSGLAASALKKAESDVEIAKLKLDKLKAPPTEEELAIYQAGVEKARVAVILAQEGFDRNAYSNGLEKSREARDLQTSQMDLQIAQAKLAQLTKGPRAEDLALAEADVRSAEADLNQAKASYDYEAGVEQTQASQREASIRARETDLKQREVERGRLAAKVKELALSAPFRGTIVSLDIKLGDKVSPFQTLGILADPADLEVAALVDEESMPLLSLGQAAETLIDGFPNQKHKATVKNIASKPIAWQGKQVYEVRLGFSDKSKIPATIRMGSDVFFTISKSKVLVVPLAALQGDSGKRYVEVSSGSSRRRVSVSVGLTSDKEAEITGGLREGDVVTVPSSP